MRQKRPRIPTPMNRKRARIYRERNRVLRAMGYADYRAYLASPLWSEIRARVLANNPECFGGCGNAATQVHHSAYRKKDLEGRDLRRLIPVCGDCHRQAEYRRGDHEKMTPQQATMKLRQLAARRKATVGGGLG